MLEKYGPWALIVGGSEGVGESFAVRLAAEGFDLVLLARKAEPLEALAERIRSTGRQVRTLSLDVTVPDALERVRVLTDDLDVGLLIFLAGATHRIEAFHDVAIEDWMVTVNCNVVAPTRFAHHFGGRMRTRGTGGIVLVGSVAGMTGSGKIAVYSASKAFNTTLAEGLWIELQPHGVDVLGLVLGSTATPAMARLGVPIDHPEFPAASPDSVVVEAFEHLGHEPVWFTDGNGPFAEQLRSMPREQAIGLMTASTESLNQRSS